MLDIQVGFQMALVDDIAVSAQSGERFGCFPGSRYRFNQKSWDQKLLLSCMIELPCGIIFSTVDVRAFDDGC